MNQLTNYSVYDYVSSKFGTVSGSSESGKCNPRVILLGFWNLHYVPVLLVLSCILFLHLNLLFNSCCS